MSTSPANTNARDEIDPWFVVAVAANYFLGPAAVLVLCTGWLWDTRGRGEDANP